MPETFQTCPRLEHATYATKLGSIKRLGLRVSKRTKRATAFCQRYINHEYDDVLGHGHRRTAPIEFDCIRDEAYRKSEEMLEKVRREEFPHLPSRQNASFFAPEGVYDEDTFCTEKDEYDNKICNFGFGKDVVLSVPSCEIPCTMGVGDTEESDRVFTYYVDMITTGDKAKRENNENELVVRARMFWENAEIYNPDSYTPYLSTELGESVKHENPEIWAPCAIPSEKIRVDVRPERAPKWAVYG